MNHEKGRPSHKFLVLLWMMESTKFLLWNCRSDSSIGLYNHVIPDALLEKLGQNYDLSRTRSIGGAAPVGVVEDVSCVAAELSLSLACPRINQQQYRRFHL